MTDTTLDTSLESIRASLPDDPASRLDTIVRIVTERLLNPHLQLELCIEGGQLAEQLGDLKRVALFFYRHGSVLFALSDYPAAYEQTKRAVEMYAQLQLQWGIARARASLGSICIQTGDYAEAMEHLEKALDIANQNGQREMETHTLTLLGILHQRLGEHEAAISSFLHALAIEEELGQPESVAAILGNLGWVSSELGDYDSSLEYYRKSLKAFREIGSMYGQATSLDGIGNVQRQFGYYGDALATYKESLEIAVDIGDRLSQSQALSGIGSVHLEMGDVSSAHDAIRRSLKIKEGIGDENGIAEVLMELAKIHLRQGQQEDAFASLSRAIDIAQRLNAAPILAKAHKAISDYYEQEGNAPQALEHYKEYHCIDAGIHQSEGGTKLQYLQTQLNLERLEKESAIARLKAERVEHELTVARGVQMQLLPANAPQMAQMDIASLCIPALEVGGDYYDFFRFDEHNLAVAIGDIAGKGIPAAIQMTLVKGVLLSHAKSDVSPQQVLAEVNQHIHANFRRGWFASMIYARIDTARMQLNFACAGHNPPLVIRNGGCISPEHTRGIALGLAAGPLFTQTLNEYTVDLVSGDTVVLYTDGYSEAMNEQRDEFGDMQLIESVIRHVSLPEAASILEAVGADVNAFTGNAVRHDDMTMVVVRVA
jgi:serine phosphatase RsbU (regulator of sigma subunit)